jgi:hypothetical protein
VASNKCPDLRACSVDRTEGFIVKVLSILKRSSLTRSWDIETELFEISVAFSMPRILEYAKLLRQAIVFVYAI